jgi:AraC-like DNA-binding protein
MLVQALRTFLSTCGQSGVGWFFALSDKHIGLAIGAMHADPATRWTLENLAGRAGMSRSVFARRLKELVGTPPLDYLTRWRMLVASERLPHSDINIASVANAVGYESESAFSTAFKRTMDCSPREYRMRRLGAQRVGDSDSGPVGRPA